MSFQLTQSFSLMKNGQPDVPLVGHQIHFLSASHPPHTESVKTQFTTANCDTILSVHHRLPLGSARNAGPFFLSPPFSVQLVTHSQVTPSCLWDRLTDDLRCLASIIIRTLSTTGLPLFPTLGNRSHFGTLPLFANQPGTRGIHHLVFREDVCVLKGGSYITSP